MSNEEVVQELGGFDPLVVHRRDPKTGKPAGVEHFRMIAHKGVRFYEWPVSSRNLWYENREHAGRLRADGTPDKGIPHEKFVPVLTEDQVVGAENAALKQENKRLMEAMTLIKKEQEIESKLGENIKPVTSAKPPEKGSRVASTR